MCRLVLAAHAPVPQPAIHDEFSYLLGADTLMHGRLANPPHPLAEFFDSPHVLEHPTYASKYQPGQALVLAAGWKLFGSPFAGVILGGALMIFQFTLMLCAWTSLRWAAALSAAIALHFLPPFYWVDSYWGGCVAATGAAAVLFGIGRHRTDRWRWSGIFIGIGLLLLFFTRPWEGAVLAAASLGIHALELWRASIKRCEMGWTLLVAVAAPVLLAGVIWDGYYNHAVTGHATELPYLLFDREYNVTPVFWFRPLRSEPRYTHPRLAAQHGLHGWEANVYRSAAQPLRRAVHAFAVLGPIGVLLLLLPLAWRDRRTQIMLVLCTVSALALAGEVWGYLHYAAPASAPLAILLAVVAERASGARLGSWPLGKMLVVGLVLAVCVVSGYRVVRTARVARPSPDEFGQRRAAFLQRMSRLPGRQLVFVHYRSPAWDVGDEWVYNGADIDGQTVVLAHDLGSAENAKLVQYFPGRTAWLLTPGEGAYQLAPYAAR